MTVQIRSGVVLRAREQLTDPNFSGTLVLVCVYSKEGGAYGLVLNRLAHMPLSEIFDGIEKNGWEPNENRKVYVGGPVCSEEVQVLQLTDEPVADSHKIATGIYLGGKWESTDELIKRMDNKSTRLFLGYSGWSPGQLESEIETGAWDILKPRSLKKFLSDQESKEEKK